MDSLSKTSRFICGALRSAMQRGDVTTKYMAEDTKQSAQAITNHRHTMPATPAAAVKDANYLQDFKFNGQMAAIYFGAVAMYNQCEFSEKFQGQPTATWIELRDTEKDRFPLGDKMARFIKYDQDTWSDEEKEDMSQFIELLLRTISVSTLLAQQLEEVLGIDLVECANKFNKRHGDLGGD